MAGNTNNNCPYDPTCPEQPNNMPSPSVTSPQVAVNDIGSAEDFLAAIDKTIKYFNDGDIVEGTIVKVDRDEVLLDIGYKTEGVIPSRELSIKHDVDPNEVVSVGDEVEALVLTKEDKEGRLILSKKRAQYERAWGTIEELKEKDEAVKGTVIEVVKGGLILDIGLRGFLPASLVEMRRVRDLQPYIGKEIEAKIIELDKNRNNVVLSPPRLAGADPVRGAQRVPQPAAEGRHPQGCRVLDRQLRRVRRSRRRRRSGARLRAVLEAHRPSVRGRQRRRRGHRRGARRRHGPRAGFVVAQGDSGRSVAPLRPHPRHRADRAGQGHQAGAVRCVRPRRGGHRGPGAHLRAGRAPRRGARTRWCQVGDDAMVKVIDIDLERRRISLSLKQANEDYTEEFDPSKYGMADSYDEQGNYIFPEGFDSETNEWLEGFDKQRDEWEARYAEAERRHKMHTAQMEKFAAAEAEEAARASSSSQRLVAVGGVRPAVRWPATPSWLRCGRSSPAAPRAVRHDERPPWLVRAGAFVVSASLTDWCACCGSV